MAVAALENMVALPSQDMFINLLSDMDRVDTWDVEHLRSKMYFQAQHLLNNNHEEISEFAPFKCLHVADSRGMWFGIFPNFDTVRLHVLPTLV